MQTYMLAVLLVVVLLAAAATNAQMTFSDGWGVKRSAMKPFQAADQDKTGLDNPLLEECHTSYSQSLIDLHHKIMVLYENYQQCQSRALTAFHTKQRQQNS